MPKTGAIPRPANPLGVEPGLANLLGQLLGGLDNNASQPTQDQNTSSDNQNIINMLQGVMVQVFGVFGNTGNPGEMIAEFLTSLPD